MVVVSESRAISSSLEEREKLWKHELKENVSLDISNNLEEREKL